MYKIEPCEREYGGTASWFFILRKQRQGLGLLGRWIKWDELGRFDTLEQAEMAMRENVYSVPPGTRFYDGKGEFMEHREGRA